VTDLFSARAYAEQRSYALGVLAKRCPWLQAAEREEMVHEAYLVMLEKHQRELVDLGAMHATQVRAYLVQTALHKALDAGKRAWRGRVTALHDVSDVVDPATPPDELLLADADQEQVRELVATLPARQQAILRLRFQHERSPQQISRELGVTHRVYRRELERAKRRIRDDYGALAG
jgi:RNA polymerase sigma factor (sigma-70 family)